MFPLRGGSCTGCLGASFCARGLAWHGCSWQFSTSHFAYACILIHSWTFSGETREILIMAGVKIWFMYCSSLSIPFSSIRESKSAESFLEGLAIVIAQFQLFRRMKGNSKSGNDSVENERAQGADLRTSKFARGTEADIICLLPTSGKEIPSNLSGLRAQTCARRRAPCSKPCAGRPTSVRQL